MAQSPVLRSETVHIEPSTSFDLHVLVKRYTLAASPLSYDQDALTLVFFHASGFFKEVWEPVIQRLLIRVHTINDSNLLKIKNIFSIECPNHGESALLNEDVLDRKYLDYWPNRQYARAAQVFLTAGEEGGAKVDFTKCKLVGIGHSMGAAALVMLVNMAPELHFERLMLIEAAISRPDVPERFSTNRAFLYLAWTRRDVWPDLESAMKEFRANPIFCKWDPRVFELFSRYALRKHPASKFPPPYDFHGITTALTKRQEAAGMRDDELVYEALSEYSELTRKMPVHVIFGDTHDIAPPELQRVQTDETLGCYPASASYINGVGHLVIQQAPDAVADEIFTILMSCTTQGTTPKCKSFL